MTAAVQQAPHAASSVSSAKARPLRFITCGNVDDGKSTLIGRLLWDTKMVIPTMWPGFTEKVRRRVPTTMTG